MSPETFAKGMRRLKGAVSQDPFDEEKTEIANAFGDSVASNFAVQQNPDGSAWPARKTNPPNPMLIRTGKMFVAATSPGGEGNITKIDHREIRFRVDDSKVHYAKYHHRGTKKKDGSVLMAKRRFFYLQKDDLKYVRDPLNRGLYRILVMAMRG
jgi:phage virion morphogenesis protein